MRKKIKYYSKSNNQKEEADIKYHWEDDIPLVVPSEWVYDDKLSYKENMRNRMFELHKASQKVKERLRELLGDDYGREDKE
jgi:hypothetical protein